jgi:hypothetical protein
MNNFFVLPLEKKKSISKVSSIVKDVFIQHLSALLFFLN